MGSEIENLELHERLDKIMAKLNALDAKLDEIIEAVAPKEGE